MTNFNIHLSVEQNYDDAYDNDEDFIDDRPLRKLKKKHKKIDKGIIFYIRPKKHFLRIYLNFENEKKSYSYP